MPCSRSPRCAPRRWRTSTRDREVMLRVVPRGSSGRSRHPAARRQARIRRRTQRRQRRHAAAGRASTPRRLPRPQPPTPKPASPKADAARWPRSRRRSAAARADPVSGESRARMLLSALVALILTVLPLPAWSDVVRPQFLVLMVLYWSIDAPRAGGIALGFFAGLVLDVFQGPVLGRARAGARRWSPTSRCASTSRSAPSPPSSSP